MASKTCPRPGLQLRLLVVAIGGQACTIVVTYFMHMAAYVLAYVHAYGIIWSCMFHATDPVAP